MSNIKKLYLILSFFLTFIFCFTYIYIGESKSVFKTNKEFENIENYLLNFYGSKSTYILKNEPQNLKSLFDTEQKYGKWAYEFELKKMEYMNKWKQKQGAEFKEIVPRVEVKKIKKKSEDLYTCYIIVGTLYSYYYENFENDLNYLRVGTYHSVTVKELGEQNYIILKEWYMDPFFDNISLDDGKIGEIRNFILNYEAENTYDLSESRINALEYACKYYGAANDNNLDFVYNKKYENYNPKGGDCANFLSQTLLAGGFKKTKTWNYDSHGGSRSWLNAESLTRYMINSKRATLISQGKYEKVYKDSYNLRPGDFIAYEREGTIVHVSLVTGKDSKGYPLVSCHNADRNNVPFDIGFSGNDVKYYLVSVHY